MTPVSPASPTVTVDVSEFERSPSPASDRTKEEMQAALEAKMAEAEAQQGSSIVPLVLVAGAAGVGAYLLWRMR